MKKLKEFWETLLVLSVFSLRSPNYQTPDSGFETTRSWALSEDTTSSENARSVISHANLQLSLLFYNIS